MKFIIIIIINQLVSLVHKKIGQLYDIFVSRKIVPHASRPAGYKTPPCEQTRRRFAVYLVGELLGMHPHTPQRKPRTIYHI